MEHQRFTLALMLFPLLTQGQAVEQKNIQLTIEKFTPTAFGFNVLVSVKNSGKLPVVLAKAAGDKPNTLQSLGMQQWDAKMGWQGIGPCRDVPPSTVITLGPGQIVENLIPVGDRAHGWSSTICPNRIEHLGGKVRAALSYVYQNEKQFRDRDPRARVDIVSAVVDLPSQE
jgi:hypothetical protein